MNKLLKYRWLAVCGFILLYIYWQNRKNTALDKSIKKIEQERLILQDSVQKLTFRTMKRDQELREIIKRDLEIMDTLNFTLKRLNNSSNKIERKIEQNKKLIDALWDN